MLNGGRTAGSRGRGKTVPEIIPEIIVTNGADHPETLEWREFQLCKGSRIQDIGPIIIQY